MTLLIPLLLRLTTLFERGSHMEEPLAEDHVISEEPTAITEETE